MNTTDINLLTQDYRTSARRQQASIEARIAHIQHSIDTLAKAGLSWTRGFYNLQDKLADLQIQAHAAEVELNAERSK
jgi:hypothetical protein